LYCPACWELLKILCGGDPQLFQVHEHHNLLFQVDLLPWLPIDVIQEMVNQFKNYLCLQLETDFSTKHGHRSNPSTSSTMSGDSISGMTNVSDESNDLGLMPNDYDSGDDIDPKVSPR
jgi:hypothetical protein